MAKRIVPVIVILSLVGYFGYSAWQNKMEAAQDDSYYGTVEAVEVLVSPQLTGRVIELNAVEGHTVGQGALMVKIDDTLYNAQLAQAQASKEAALSQQAVLDASIAGLQLNIDRLDRLVGRDYASKANLDQLNTQKDILLAQKVAVDKQAAMGEATINLAEKQIGYTIVNAPVSGTILRVHTELGEMAFPGSALFTLADLSVMEVRTYIPEPMLGKIKLGMKVKVFNDSYPDKPMEGKVAFISDRAEFTPKNVQTKNERTRLIYGVKATVPNPDGILKIGMPVDVEFVEGTVPKPQIEPEPELKEGSTL
jgi:RND family efflux transporter MFP subunit